MGKQTSLDVPPAWEQIDFSGLSGTLMVVGAPDVGKSTFARYLYRRLNEQSPLQKAAVAEGSQSESEGRRVAFLDGDPGQSSFGPPATITLCFDLQVADTYPAAGDVWRYFIGAVSPRGHMLPLVVGVSRLIQAAYDAGAQFIVYDTTGLIDPSQGGLALKHAKINLLQPVALFAIQREQELEPLLVPLRRSHRLKVVSLQPSAAAQRRDVSRRQSHRRDQFARYFVSAHTLALDWTKMAVFPLPRFSLNRLVALEDAAGFTLGLGIVRHIDRAKRSVRLHTPLPDLRKVNALHVGDIALDPQTFHETKLGY